MKGQCNYCGLVVDSITHQCLKKPAKPLWDRQERFRLNQPRTKVGYCTKCKADKEHQNFKRCKKKFKAYCKTCATTKYFPKQI